MTVMLLQHTALQHYKLPSPPPPRMSKPVPTTITYSSYSDCQAKNPNRRPINPLTAYQHPQQQGCKTTAMRYYRLWIYTCNAVLLVSVLGFAIVAGRIVVADSRRYLVPGLALYQPTFLYAYLALATQSGLLQLVGCLGALRLNERLLNVYWLLLLVLLFGDAIVGVVWVFRFDKICADLRPTLKQRLAAEYGVDRDFTELWDALQREYKCCGVEGAHDYSVVGNRTATTTPVATSSTAPTAPIGNGSTMHGSSTAASVVAPTAASAPDEAKSEWGWNQHSHRQPDGVNHDAVPQSCCRFLTEKQPTVKDPSIAAGRTALASETDANRVPTDSSHQATTSANQKPANPCVGGGAIPPLNSGVTGSQTHFHITGCEDRLQLWLRQSADILFVLGYCVIAFLKLCFLGILRYEIREMIQKIKILHGEMRPPTLLLTELGGGGVSPSGIQSPAHAAVAGATTAAAAAATGATPPHLQPLLMNHTRAASSGNNGDLGACTAGGSLQTTPLHAAALSHRHLSMLNNDGTDSDTNSNCALIISEDVSGGSGGGSSKAATGGARGGCGSNGNNNYEIHELQELNRLLSRHQTQI